MSDTRSRVEQVVESNTGATGADQDEALKDFDWVDHIQLAVDLEDEFGVEVSDRELETRESVEDISSYIESLLTAKEV